MEIKFPLELNGKVYSFKELNSGDIFTMRGDYVYMKLNQGYKISNSWLGTALCLNNNSVVYITEDDSCTKLKGLLSICGE